MLLLHALEVPVPVEARLVPHLQGADGQAVQQLRRRPVEPRPRRGGDAPAPRQPGAGRAPLRLPEDAQLAPQRAHGHFHAALPRRQVVFPLLRQGLRRFQQRLGAVDFAGEA